MLASCVWLSSRPSRNVRDPRNQFDRKCIDTPLLAASRRSDVMVIVEEAKPNNHPIRSNIIKNFHLRNMNRASESPVELRAPHLLFSNTHFHTQNAFLYIELVVQLLLMPPHEANVHHTCCWLVGSGSYTGRVWWLPIINIFIYKLEQRL